MADPPGNWHLMVSRETKKSANKQGNTTDVAPAPPAPRVVGMQPRSQMASASLSATMADAPEHQHLLASRKAKEPKTKQDNTTHIAPRLATDMQQHAPEAPVIIPSNVSDFPSLPGALVVPGVTGPQISPNTAHAADTLERTLSHSAVQHKAAGLPAPENSTTNMPSEVAKGMKRKAAHRIVMENEAEFGRLFATLPRELRNDTLHISVPGFVDVASADFDSALGSDPDFVPAFASKTNEGIHLEIILYILQNSMLKLSGLQDLNNLTNWLASIDFSPMAGPGATGFDFVRALSFSDINRSAAVVSDQNWPAPSSWAEDLQLTRICTALRHVEVELSLSDRFLSTIKDANSMTDALRTMYTTKEPGEDNSQTYQLTRLLELKGLEVLRLRFLTEKWNMTTLNEEKKRMITSWLEKGFKALNQSVVVVPFGWWE